MRNIVYLNDTREAEIERWINCDNMLETWNYNQPSVSPGSIAIDPNTTKKYSKKKEIPESCKKQNLNLLHISNYLHNIYVIFV